MKVSDIISNATILKETENEASLILCDKLGFTAVEEGQHEGRGYFRLLCAAPLTN